MSFTSAAGRPGAPDAGSSRSYVGNWRSLVPRQPRTTRATHGDKAYADLDAIHRNEGWSSGPSAENPLNRVATGAERGDVEESSRHDDVLQKMGQRVGIGKIAIRDERGRDAPGGEDTRDDAGLNAQQKRDPAEKLDHNCDAPGSHWDGEAEMGEE